MEKMDLTGKRFGRLVVIKETDPYIKLTPNHKRDRRRIRRMWVCDCDCGGHLTVLGESLVGGNTKSCGCIQKDGTLKKNYLHGAAGKARKITKEYRTFQRIKGRCYCKTDGKYSRYGARGIKVCERWLKSFENFLSDMGKCPEDKASIERINNDGDYEPSNCKWATMDEQAQNKSTSIMIEYNGLRMNLKQWCRKLNLNYEPVRKKIRNKNMCFSDIVNF